MNAASVSQSPTSAPTSPAVNPIPFSHLSPKWMKALEKAERIIAESGEFAHGTDGEYFVFGANDTYRVTVTDAGYSCTCPAHSVCYHRAAVALKLRGQQPTAKPMPKVYNCSRCGATNVDPLHEFVGCF